MTPLERDQITKQIEVLEDLIAVITGVVSPLNQATNIDKEWLVAIRDQIMDKAPSDAAQSPFLATVGGLLCIAGLDRGVTVFKHALAKGLGHAELDELLKKGVEDV